MNKHFLNSFKKVNFGDMVNLNMQLKTGKITIKPITAEDIQHVKKYMLNSEYISEHKENTITVSTNKSEYIIRYYNNCIVLTEKINCYTILDRNTTNYYIKNN